MNAISGPYNERKNEITLTFNTPEARESDIRKLKDQPVKEGKRQSIAAAQKAKAKLEPLAHAQFWNPISSKGALIKGAKRTAQVITKDVPRGWEKTKKATADAYERPAEKAKRLVVAQNQHERIENATAPTASADRRAQLKKQEADIAITDKMSRSRFLSSQLKSNGVIAPFAIGKGAAFTADALTAGKFTGGHGLMQWAEMANSYENSAAGPALLLHGLIKLIHIPGDAVEKTKLKKALNKEIAAGNIKPIHLKEQSALQRALTGNGTADMFAHAELMKRQGYDVSEVNKINKQHVLSAINSDLDGIKKQQSRTEKNSLIRRLLDPSLGKDVSLHFDETTSEGQVKLAHLTDVMDSEPFKGLLNDAIKHLPPEKQQDIRNKLIERSNNAKKSWDQKVDSLVTNAVLKAHGHSAAGRASVYTGKNLKRAAAGTPGVMWGLSKPFVLAPYTLVKAIVTAPRHLVPPSQKTRADHEKKITARHAKAQELVDAQCQNPNIKARQNKSALDGSWGKRTLEKAKINHVVRSELHQKAKRKKFDEKSQKKLEKLERTANDKRGMLADAKVIAEARLGKEIMSEHVLPASTMQPRQRPTHVLTKDTPREKEVKRIADRMVSVEQKSEKKIAKMQRRYPNEGPNLSGE